jgi:glycosyltransferase involved in cell wall biosynthesis
MRISVAMCTYNGSRFLREQLDSISRQSRLPDELIVSDDCSTDCTVEIIREFSATVPFEVNFEKCIQLCTGDLIVLSDQDDYWYFDRLQTTENVMIDRPDAGALFADADVVDCNLNPLGYRLWKAVHFNDRLRRQFAQDKAFEALIAHNVVTGATMAFRAEFRPLLVPIPPLWIFVLTVL